MYSNTLIDKGTSVRATVRLTDESGAGAGARGTVVHAIWTRADGSTFDQYASIGTRLRATFNLYTAGVPGHYKFTVVAASKTGYTFEPGDGLKSHEDNDC